MQVHIWAHGRQLSRIVTAECRTKVGRRPQKPQKEEQLGRTKREYRGFPPTAGGRQLVRRLAGLPADSDGLHLKMAAAEKRGYSDELARWQVLGSEVRTVDTVEFVE